MKLRAASLGLATCLALSFFSSAQVANAGLFGPDCNKVHPSGKRLMSDIARIYPNMVLHVNRFDYTKAFSAYKVLNKKNNELSNLMSSGKNYRCFLDTDYEKSSYKWIQEYPGRGYGGTVKTPCILWGVGCRTVKNPYANPCDGYTLAADYRDCIEDQSRPSDSGYVD